MIINKLISKIASWVKNEPFSLDKNISDTYLIILMCQKIIMYCRGLLRLQKIILIGKNTKIISANLLTFGKSVMIDDECIINALSKEGILLGNNVSIQKRTIIECTGSLRHLGKGLVLGNNAGIGSNSFLGCAGGIEIGDDTIIGNYVSFHSENHNFDRNDIPIRLQGVNHKGIKIGNNCWIGAKVTILDGTVVGDGCVIAAGAVLNGKTYPSNSVIGGVPAKVLKKR